MASSATGSERLAPRRLVSDKIRWQWGGAQLQVRRLGVLSSGARQASPGAWVGRARRRVERVTSRAGKPGTVVAQQAGAGGRGTERAGGADAGPTRLAPAMCGGGGHRQTLDLHEEVSVWGVRVLFHVCFSKLVVKLTHAVARSPCFSRELRYSFPFNHGKIYIM